MKFLLRVLAVPLSLLFTFALLAVLAAAGIYAYIAPQVPDAAGIREVKLQEPLRVYTASGRLIGEFGEKFRTPVAFAQLPDPLLKAFLAAEDDRFFEHPGVDYHGLLRAGLRLLRSGEKRHGGSTITMQVARNFFLSSERTFQRKFAEILLALRIERQLSKEEILELYLNKIFFGHRAYGVAAAAKIYYGKSLEELSLAECAMLAGLPKAPSLYNPVVNPQRALERRDYVLVRMSRLGYISPTELKAALAEPDHAYPHWATLEFEAPFVAEMVRREMIERYGEEAAYTGGYRVFTTIDERLQHAATQALRSTVIAYDERHGYRGPERRFSLDGSEDEGRWQELLAPVASYGALDPALVIRAQADKAWIYVKGQGVRVLDIEGVKWARRYLSINRRGAAPAKLLDAVRVGDLVRVRAAAEDGSLRLAQLPALEGAMVALDPSDGAILALSGGFDFQRSKFNRAVDALRQPGSSFKPFIYSAALERGLSPASIVVDEPRTFSGGGGRPWRPKNYDGRYAGPVRVRDALTHSRNLASIDLLRKVGVDYASDYARRFGFKDQAVPHGLSIALGTGVMSPLELAAGYAVFANGGFRIEPYLIERIEDATGTTVYQARPLRACLECDWPGLAPQGQEARSFPMGHSAGQWNPAPRVTNARNVYQMISMLGDVIRYGTGRRALSLKRSDIAGKTGTTNDQRDAWFSGFQKDIVATTWVGFDKFEPLGNRETGGRAALPMWTDFMRVALEGKPEALLPMPPGLITVSVDRSSGRLTAPEDPGAIQEIVREESWGALYDRRDARYDGEAPGWEEGDGPGAAADAGSALGDLF